MSDENSKPPVIGSVWRRKDGYQNHSYEHPSYVEWFLEESFDKVIVTDIWTLVIGYAVNEKYIKFSGGNGRGTGLKNSEFHMLYEET